MRKLHQCAEAIESISLKPSNIPKLLESNLGETILSSYEVCDFSRPGKQVLATQPKSAVQRAPRAIPRG